MKRICLSFLMMLVLSPATAQACSVCFGESDSELAQGMNMGILVLLLVITSVLFGVASFFVYLAKRSSRMDLMGAGQAVNSRFSENPTNA